MTALPLSFSKPIENQQLIFVACSMTTTDEDIEDATEEGHVEAPNESTEEGNPSRLLRIFSVIFAKDQFEMLCKKYDTDGDNHIDSQELARITADMTQSKTEKRHLKWALIGSLAAVVVLLCSTFATSWAAASLLRKVNTNDNTGDLIMRRRARQ
jgi:hypothetical protein